MTAPLVVLRPEPGNRATAAAIEAAGLTAIRLPLFDATAIPWTSPAPTEFDALLLTSANALRHGGAGLTGLIGLPVWAVGAATGRAARARGFGIVAIGERDACELLAAMRRASIRRVLHLGARDTNIAVAPPVARSIAVYASDARLVAGSQVRTLAGAVALLHSARAARRLAELVDTATLPRATLRLAAISRAVADAAGTGWGARIVAERVDDAALITAAATLAD